MQNETTKTGDGAVTELESASQGGPTKFTPELKAKLLELIELGMPLTHAADAVGIAFSTLCNWRQANADFADEVERAVASGMQRHLENIVRASATDWRASAWILSHRFPSQWGRTSVDLTSNGTPLALIDLPEKDAR